MAQSAKQVRSTKVAAAPRPDIIKAVQTPLGYYVLIVLVVEGIMGGLAAFTPTDRIKIIYVMAGLIVLLVLVVFVLTIVSHGALVSDQTLLKVRPTGLSSMLSKNEKSREVLSQPNQSNILIRCSFSGLIRIEVNDRYLLVRGRRIAHQFQPVGGVYKRHLSSLSDLRRMNIQDDDKMPVDNHSKDDLRVRVTASDVQVFVDWFMSRQGREIDPWREFYEELVATGILRQQEFPYILSSFLKTHVTDIQWSDYMQCYELMIAEVFVLHPTAPQIAELERLQREPDNAFRWVTHAEIASRGLSSGVATISPTAGWLF